jgi:hypothetical protein
MNLFFYSQVNFNFIQDTSVLTKSGNIEAFDDTYGSALNQTQTVYGGHDQQKEIHLLNESSLPHSSHKRLPYHIFTLMEKEPVEKWQMPLIFNEVNIHNVQVIIDIFFNLKIFKLSCGFHLLKIQSVSSTIVVQVY